MFLYIGLQDRVEVLKLAIGNQANNKYLKNGWGKKKGYSLNMHTCRSHMPPFLSHKENACSMGYTSGREYFNRKSEQE